MTIIFIALYLSIIALALYYLYIRPSPPKLTIISLLGPLKHSHVNLNRFRFAQAFRRWAPSSDYNDNNQSRQIILALWSFIQNNPYHTIWNSLPQDFHQALTDLSSIVFAPSGPQSLPPKGEKG